MLQEKEIQMLVQESLDLAYKKFQEKKFEIVVVITEQILKVSPDECGAMQLLGLSYSSLKRHDEAIKIFQKCLSHHPNNAETLNDLALCHANNGNFDEAIDLLQKAISIKSDMPELYGNLGLQHRHKEEHEKAIFYFKKSLSLKETAITHAMLGGCYGEMKEFENAKTHIERALEIQPDFAAAHVDLASILCLEGKLTEGFKEYEWRYDVYDQLKVWKKIYNQSKRWRGGNLNGKKIIVHTEQGHGDSIHFVRYLKPLKEKGAHIILHCNDSLKGIFEGLADEFFTTEPDKIEDWEKGNSIPEHDYYIPLLSLPHELGSIFTYPSYIHVKRKFDLSSYSEVNKVGIVWAGNPQHPNDKQRSCNLKMFRGIANLPNIKLFSLMKDTRKRAYLHHKEPIDLTEDSNDMKVVDLQEYIHDFEDTAAIINSLDLIIGVDTAVIHLAGAMGKPCLLLLPWNPDWRWEANGENTIWYGRMHIVRQKRKNDWDSVFEEAERMVKLFFDAKKGHVFPHAL